MIIDLFGTIPTPGHDLLIKVTELSFVSALTVLL